MQLLIEPNEKRAVPSLYDDRSVPFPELRQGEIVPLEIGLVKRIRFPYNGQVFEPLAAPDDFRVAVGNGFILPLAGTFTVEDSDEIDSDATREDIETALNDITGIGGVTVTGANGFFVITWDDTGAQDLLTGDAGNLVPLSLLSFRRSVTGDASTREVQTLRVYQNAGAIAVIDTPATTPGVSVDTVEAGGMGVNTQVRVIFDGDVYGGTWIFSAGASPDDSDPLDFGWSAARLQVALEAVSTIGSGNVLVKQESELQFLVTFIGDLAGTALAGIDVDGSGLLGLNLLTGTLDLRAQGIDLLLADGSPLVTTLEIQSETTAGPAKVLDQDVLLTGGIIESGMTETEGEGATPITLPQVTRFTGGTATDLDFVTTTNKAKDSGIPYMVRIDGQFFPMYLESGAADGSDPGQIQALDDAAVHWTRGL